MGGLNGWACMPAPYTRRELGILDIFSEYSLKYLECTRICSNILDISLLGGRGGLIGEWVGGRTDNLSLKAVSP
jgi:hypothetical protein